jgi:hypothetical protein
MLRLSGVTPGERDSDPSHRESVATLRVEPLTHDTTSWSTRPLCANDNRKSTGCSKRSQKSRLG